MSGSLLESARSALEEIEALEVLAVDTLGQITARQRRQRPGLVDVYPRDRVPPAGWGRSERARVEGGVRGCELGVRQDLGQVLDDELGGLLSLLAVACGGEAARCGGSR